jgi:hypothetical protein
MIVYLKNDEIDRNLWDTCISSSQATKPYAYSWYLDIMAPGWEAMIDDDYDSVFPIPSRSRLGIKYIATPVFLQQLGAFSPDKSPEKAIDEFLDYLPEFYKLIDLCVAQKINRRGFTLNERSNYELDLSLSYESLWNNFTAPCRRNIEKSARKKTELVYDITPSELIDVFIILKERVIKGIKPRDFQRLKSLMEYCIKNGTGKIAGVRASRKRILFGQFFIEMPGFINLFFGVNTPESRERRLNYFFVNEIIRKNAGKDIILDFAGSSIPSIATFMESFGPVNNRYYRIYRNFLPWPVKLLK